MDGDEMFEHKKDFEVNEPNPIPSGSRSDYYQGDCKNEAANWLKHLPFANDFSEYAGDTKEAMESHYFQLWSKKDSFQKNGPTVGPIRTNRMPMGVGNHLTQQGGTTRVPIRPNPMQFGLGNDRFHEECSTEGAIRPDAVQFGLGNDRFDEECRTEGEVMLKHLPFDFFEDAADTKVAMESQYFQFWSKKDSFQKNGQTVGPIRTNPMPSGVPNRMPMREPNYSAHQDFPTGVPIGPNPMHFGLGNDRFHEECRTEGAAMPGSMTPGFVNYRTPTNCTEGPVWPQCVPPGFANYRTPTDCTEGPVWGNKSAPENLQMPRYTCTCSAPPPPEIALTVSEYRLRSMIIDLNTALQLAQVGYDIFLRSPKKTDDVKKFLVHAKKFFLKFCLFKACENIHEFRAKLFVNVQAEEMTNYYEDHFIRVEAGTQDLPKQFELVVKALYKGVPNPSPNVTESTSTNAKANRPAPTPIAPHFLNYPTCEKGLPHSVDLPLYLSMREMLKKEAYIEMNLTYARYVQSHDPADLQQFRTCAYDYMIADRFFQLDPNQDYKEMRQIILNRAEEDTREFFHCLKLD